MWLSIIAVIEKIFDILCQLTGFWIKRSDAAKAERDQQQAKMDQAAKDGNFDDWKNARYRRNNV
jgi:hypothetical protein